MNNNLKILLLGDYSNCHANLAAGLRERGHDVTLMKPLNHLSNNTFDIDISRTEGKLGGLILYAKALTKWHKYLRGYDIVSINDPVFLNLHPKRLKPLFSRLREENDKIIYTAMSIDVNYIEMCEKQESPLKFNEFFVEGKPSPWNLENPGNLEGWKNKSLIDYENFVFDRIDGGAGVLYEYYVGLRNRLPEEKTSYTGIPVNSKKIPFIGPRLKGKTKILLCRDSNRIKLKGSDILEKAAQGIVKRYPQDVELVVADNLPYNLFLEKLQESDVVLDQVYSYTPATTALLAMAMGKTVVSGGEQEFYDFIKEKENHPIVNASYKPEDLTTKIKEAALNRSFLIENGEKSRKFVEKHNDVSVVAEKFLNFYNKLCNLS